MICQNLELCSLTLSLPAFSLACPAEAKFQSFVGPVGSICYVYFKVTVEPIRLLKIKTLHECVGACDALYLLQITGCDCWETAASLHVIKNETVGKCPPRMINDKNYIKISAVYTSVKLGLMAKECVNCTTDVELDQINFKPYHISGGVSLSGMGKGVLGKHGGVKTNGSHLGQSSGSRSGGELASNPREGPAQAQGHELPWADRSQLSSHCKTLKLDTSTAECKSHWTLTMLATTESIHTIVCRQICRTLFTTLTTGAEEHRVTKVTTAAREERGKTAEECEVTESVIGYQSACRPPCEFSVFLMLGSAFGVREDLMASHAILHPDQPP